MAKISNNGDSFFDVLIDPCEHFWFLPCNDFERSDPEVKLKDAVFFRDEIYSFICFG